MTSASGSSAVAVAAAGPREGEVHVYPGGDQRVRPHNGRVRLIGAAERVD